MTFCLAEESVLPLGRTLNKAGHLGKDRFEWLIRQVYGGAKVSTIST